MSTRSGASLRKNRQPDNSWTGVTLTYLNHLDHVPPVFLEPIPGLVINLILAVVAFFGFKND